MKNKNCQPPAIDVGKRLAINMKINANLILFSKIRCYFFGSSSSIFKTAMKASYTIICFIQQYLH